MINLLAFIGLLILSFGAVLGVTAFIGWINDDDDNYVKWYSCVIIATILLTILVYMHIV